MAVYLCGHALAQEDQTDARAVFQELYGRIDAAVASQDQAAVDRWIAGWKANAVRVKPAIHFICSS